MNDVNDILLKDLRDGVLRYRDGDHLSRSGSESLAPALEVLFGARPREAPRFEGPLRNEQ